MTNTHTAVLDIVFGKPNASGGRIYTRKQIEIALNEYMNGQHYHMIDMDASTNIVNLENVCAKVESFRLHENGNISFTYSILDKTIGGQVLQEFLNAGVKIQFRAAVSGTGFLDKRVKDLIFHKIYLGVK